MISSQRYRPSMEITLADIFQDFSDPRKQTLMRRVAIAMESLEKKMKNQLEANNLANLQMLLKKQQALKNMQQKVNQKTQENEQLRQKESYYNNKIQQLQAQANKKQQMFKTSQDKIKSISDSVKLLQTTIKTKEKCQTTLQQDKANLLQENERLEMEKQKYEGLIKKLKDTYSHKIEEGEFILKVKEKRLAETFNQSLQSLKVKSLHEKEKKEIEGILKMPKSDKKHQSIQVNMSNSPLTIRNSRKKVQEFATQTEITQQRKIGQVIEQNISIHINSQNSKKKEQIIQLEEVRLMYSKTPVSSSSKSELSSVKIKPETPKIAKCFSIITKEQVAQTEQVRFKLQSPLKTERSCQAQADRPEQTRAQIFQMEQEFRYQIRDMTAKYEKMEEFHQQRYWQIVKIYEERPSLQQDLKEIEMLKLNILSLKLEIEKKEEERSKQRELFAKVNDDLSKTQNSNLMSKVTNQHMGQKIFFSRRPKPMNKTCNIFYESPSRRAITQTSQLHRTHNPRSWDQNLQDTVDFTLLKSKRLTEPREEELITVLKGDSTIKFVVGKKHSMKSTGSYQESIIDRKAKRNYKKYSQLKKMNPLA